MQAIILAGGLGTRLGKILGEMPKVLAPVGGRPFLSYQLDELARQGFDRAVLAVGYRHEMIEQTFGRRYDRLELVYSLEESPLGTGGAIRKALVLVRNEPCFVLNGDTWTDINYAGMLANLFAFDSSISVAVHHVPDVGRFGAVHVENRRIVTFREKTAGGPGIINSGTYLVAADLFSAYPLGAAFSFEREFLQPYAQQLKPLAFPVKGPFIDIGVPDDYRRAEAVLRSCARSG